MSGESRPLKGLGPYNVWEVAVALLALGIVGIVWGFLTMVAFQLPAVLPLIGGTILFVAGLVVYRWDRTHRA